MLAACDQQEVTDVITKGWPRRHLLTVREGDLRLMILIELGGFSGEAKQEIADALATVPGASVSSLSYYLRHCSLDVAHKLWRKIVREAKYDAAVMFDVMCKHRQPFAGRAFAHFKRIASEEYSASALATAMPMHDGPYKRSLAQYIHSRLLEEGEQGDPRGFIRACEKLLRYDPAAFVDLKTRKENIEASIEQERIAKAQAEEAKRNAERLHQAAFEMFERRIKARVVAITRVLSGIFDLDVREDAVLTGEVHGSYASITYGSSSGVSPGMQLRLAQTMCTRFQSFLEIEEGQEQSEWLATLESLNFMVHHEIAHLAQPGLQDPFRSVKHGLDRLAESDGSIEHMAKEIVVDGIAMRMAMDLYVHPDYGERFYASAQEREVASILAHAKLAERVILKFGPTFDYDLEDTALFARLYTQLLVHAKKVELPNDVLVRLVGVIELISAALFKNKRLIPWWDTLADYYTQLYMQARSLDLNALRWRDDAGEEYLTGRSATQSVGIH